LCREAIGGVGRPEKTNPREERGQKGSGHEAGIALGDARGRERPPTNAIAEKNACDAMRERGQKKSTVGGASRE